MAGYYLDPRTNEIMIGTLPSQVARHHRTFSSEAPDLAHIVEETPIFPLHSDVVELAMIEEATNA